MFQVSILCGPLQGKIEILREAPQAVEESESRSPLERQGRESPGLLD
jgi:hypothetical protein